MCLFTSRIAASVEQPRPKGARANAGFSLVEMLVALAIVTMVSVIVATGVPSAIKAYHNVVASSNAQLVLSTLATELRDELGSATEACPDSSGGANSASDISAPFEVGDYLCAEGYYAKLDGNLTGNRRSPVKIVDDSRAVSARAVSAGESTISRNGDSWSLVPDAQLAGTSESLFATYDELTYDPSAKVFKVKNLRVYELVEDGSQQTLAQIETGSTDDSDDHFYAIRAPYCRATTR